VELIAGYWAGSLALMSDASHLITDSLTFLMGSIAVRQSKRLPDASMSFGYKRVDVLFAILSIIGVWILTVLVLYFAVERILNPNDFEIDADTMLVVAIVGVFVNIV